MFNKIRNAMMIRREAKKMLANLAEAKQRVSEAQGASAEFLMRHIEKEEQAVERVLNQARENYKVFGISLI